MADLKPCNVVGTVVDGYDKDGKDIGRVVLLKYLFKESRPFSLFFVKQCKTGLKIEAWIKSS